MDWFLPFVVGGEWRTNWGGRFAWGKIRSWLPGIQRREWGGGIKVCGHGAPHFIGQGKCRELQDEAPLTHLAFQFGPGVEVFQGRNYLAGFEVVLRTETWNAR